MTVDPNHPIAGASWYPDKQRGVAVDPTTGRRRDYRSKDAWDRAVATLLSITNAPERPVDGAVWYPGSERGTVVDPTTQVRREYRSKGAWDEAVTAVQSSQGLIGSAATWKHLFEAYLQNVSAPIGSATQRQSHIRCYLLPAIGARPLPGPGAGLPDYSAVCDYVLSKDRAPATTRGALTTLATIVTWAINRGYMSEEPWPRTRAGQLLKEARNTAATRHATRDEVITLDRVPGWDDLARLSAAVEAEWIDAGEDPYRARLYGLAPVVAFTSGLRLNEFLGLTARQVNINEGVIIVDQQLVKYAPWIPHTPPPTSLPKGCTPIMAATQVWRKARRARIWATGLDGSPLRPIYEELLEGACASHGGALFPPSRCNRRPVNDWVKHMAKAREASGWHWAPHYARHAYAAWSLANMRAGGKEMTIVGVQRSIGHATPRETFDTYVGPTDNEPGWV